MDEYANSLKKTLTSLIREMSATPAPYVKNPQTDFTRKKKLPFETVMQLLISMGGNSIYKELLESQGYDVNTATTSAFVQQRNKILPSAVEFLFHEFTQSYTDIKDYRGYRLLASGSGSTRRAPTRPRRPPAAWAPAPKPAQWRYAGAGHPKIHAHTDRLHPRAARQY